MGFKRPFDDEEFQELPFKQARQVDYSNKLTHFAERVPCNDSPVKPDISGHNDEGFQKLQWHDTFNNNHAMEVPNFASEVETSVPLSLVASSSIDDVGSRGIAVPSLSPGYFGFKFPWRTSVPFEDSSYLDDFPRKQVPLGPNHQANIPLWNEHKEKKKLGSVDPFSPGSSASDHDIRDENEENFMGTCIIPMPDTESSGYDGIGTGGSSADCGCLDEGSTRCARQHIMEARERLIRLLGHEIFLNLGFYDMGEVVARRWTAEEERIYHAVIYSNPASLGQNFWRHLAQVFPSRSTKEIVSYYFNVFILRRRAMQNRSTLLDIDSDDDELHGINRQAHKFQVSVDEDSDVESLVDQYDQTDQRKDTLEHDDDDDDSDSDSDDDDCNGDVGNGSGDGSGDVTGEDSGIDYVSEAQDWNSLDGSRFNPVVEHLDQKTGSVVGDFPVHDDSCMSFELQADKFDSCGPADSDAALLMSDGKSGHGHGKRMPSKVEGCSDVVSQVYLLDSCDAKVWDARYSSPIKGFDLLPTSNIIEEIFGRGTCDDKTGSDHDLS